MSRTVLSFILAVTLLTGTLIVLQAKPVYLTQESLHEEANIPFSEGVSILQADDNGLSFVLHTAVINNFAAGALASEGLNAVMQEPGAPELPYFTTYIAVPPEAVVSVEVYQKGTNMVAGVSVPAAAEPTLSYNNSDPDSPFPVTATSALLSTSVASQPAARTPNLAIYASDTLYPNTLYQLSDPVYLRDMRLVKLDLYPLQYNPLQQELQQTQQMQVNIRFEGAQLNNLRPAPTANDAYQNGASDMILNFEQGKAWRSLPMSVIGENGMVETAVSLPLGTETYKIEINQDGIYDITGADLVTAGMNISSIDPANIEMMTRGESVVYDFIKNGANNAILESSDIIRFYGEGVNGSRREKQFLTHNVYWLWPNGNPTEIAEVANSPGATTATTFTDTITREDENYFYSTWTNQWDQFPNDPDSWYWELIHSPNSQVFTTDILDPVPDGAQSATYTIEFLTRATYYQIFTYQLDACLNSPAECVQKTWINHQNVNITKTVPMTALVSGTNNFTVTLSNPVNSTRIYAYLNRISVEYLRTLKARNDQLFFTDAVGGRGMIVQDFSDNDLNNILVWDISTPISPTQIILDSGNISESGGRYTYTIGVSSSAPQNYIATTITNTLSPDAISQYTPPATPEPAAGADWVAISYGGFITQANILAAHRALDDYGGLSTHVVNIEDVVNVYGDGLPMPEAINAYLKNALETWPTKPGYVVLVGDGVVSPRNLHCLARCYADWDKDAQNFVPTDMQFTDRFQGLIPTDNTAVFLSGDDLLADMAIGRLPVETPAEAAALVEKIIKYEENLYAQTAGSKRVLFLADFPDPNAGGSFCDTNQNLTGPLLSVDYEQIHLCIEDYADPDVFDPVTYTEAIKQETSSGIALMNYRGHGAIQDWGGPSFWETATSTSNQDLKNMWANEGKPAIVLSADCLDGHFAWPGHTALSERFLRLDDMAGSAAHWSSSGLGYDAEHTTLLEGFYQGMFDHKQINIGDAANYAKLHFSLSDNYAESEMYSFNLQGDPAMLVKLPDPYDVFLPMITK